MNFTQSKSRYSFIYFIVPPLLDLISSISKMLSFFSIHENCMFLSFYCDNWKSIQRSNKWEFICKALKLFWKWRSVETITLSINKISWNNFNYIFVRVPVCLVKNEFRTATGCPKTENMFFVWQQRTNRGKKKKKNSEQNAA